MTDNHQVVSGSESIRKRTQLLAEVAADCNCAALSSVSSRTRTRARAPVGSWLGLVAGIAAVLAPKCPMCLAAYLSMLGIGVGLAKVAPMLLPLGVLLSSLALLSLVRARRSSPRGLMTSTQQERKRR